MQTLYIMCGLPGSGKSTFSRFLAEERNLTRFSFDEMGCHTTCQFIRNAMVSLRDGESVVMDSTHLKANSRRILLQEVADIDCRKVCVVMDTPFDECLRRNAIREARVPDTLMYSIHTTLENPTLSEGWDEIIYIKEDGSHETIHENNP